VLPFLVSDASIQFGTTKTTIPLHCLTRCSAHPNLSMYRTFVIDAGRCTLCDGSGHRMCLHKHSGEKDAHTHDHSHGHGDFLSGYSHIVHAPCSACDATGRKIKKPCSACGGGCSTSELRMSLGWGGQGELVAHK
jgi:hypothetical protein